MVVAGCVVWISMPVAVPPWRVDVSCRCRCTRVCALLGGCWQGVAGCHVMCLLCCACVLLLTLCILCSRKFVLWPLLCYF